jgi:hypothetical protein
MRVAARHDFPPERDDGSCVYCFGSAWENSPANAYSGVKTVVMCRDDSTPGEVYVYIGTKQATDVAVEKAGLTNGKLFGISASFGDDTGPGALTGTFQLVAQGNNGDVIHTTSKMFAWATASQSQRSRRR